LAAHNGFNGKFTAMAVPSDFNSVTTPGIYYFVAFVSITNEPISGGTNARRVKLVIEEEENNTVIVQTLYYVDGYHVGYAYQRVGNANTSVWDSWYQLNSNAVTLGGYGVGDFNSTNVTFVPLTGGNHIMEIGPTIDMHLASSTNDYDTRISTTVNGISVTPLTASATANVVRNFQSGTSTTPSSWAEGDLYGYHA
jgi:hypothetical protein